jgi:hypothetical protein
VTEEEAPGQPPYYSLVDFSGGSFRVGFGHGSDHAAIIDADGWVSEELRLTEGTCEQIRAEAHRLIDLAVTTDRWAGYSPKAGGAERKRTITRSYNAAKSTHHPDWRPGHHRSRFGGDPER